MDAINTARASFGQPPIYTATVIQRSGIMAHYRNMIYSKAIKRIRKSRGITQNKLAEMLGVEQPTVQRWESGARTPGADDMASFLRSAETVKSRIALRFETYSGEYVDAIIPASGAIQNFRKIMEFCQAR